ncbi:histidinol-phosphate transaminase [Rhodanobacter sp. L36]|uniref:pyridoxal phosphate-dependent aminotransferase n=1 Tax=Rhodanobacter sp. L36 TaxID=1747221 RepID=UPI00131C9A7B|nr:histidinol-phosphate transaminase [Rhodanobacter sp. L36]
MTQSRIDRRLFLKSAGAAAGAALLAPGWLEPALAAPLGSLDSKEATIRLCFNENPYGPSPLAVQAIQRELGKVVRYGDESAAHALVEQLAAYERLPSDHVLPGEVLDGLGLYLGTEGGAGGEFIYSTPGYLALVDATSRVGGVSVPVPLDASQRNDLRALAAKINAKTRAIYLVNPHNPSGTVCDSAAFKSFLREVSQKVLVIVDEAYLEYTDDFATRSAVDLVREGANVAVFRTFAKIHGLAGLPFGYLLAPPPLVSALRKEGAGTAEGLGRLAIVAAGAALQDKALLDRSRRAVADERRIWLSTLKDLKLPHSETVANFIFFDAGRPQPELAAAFLQRGIDIGRSFPPLAHWARITIGLPRENARAQAALRDILAVR